MENAQRLMTLARSGRTVFSTGSLERLWKAPNGTAKAAAKRMVDKRLLVRLGRGYFALDKDFDVFELANLIITPSYVSMHSALVRHGVAFQAGAVTTSVALVSDRRRVGDLTFLYYSMKSSLFFNLDGVRYSDGLAVAGPERAILDAFYFNLLPNVDEPEKLDAGALRRLSDLYPRTVRDKARRLLEAR